MARKINGEFLDELLMGSLNELLKYVREDDTLNLELRGDRITVYYRGGALLTVIKQDSYVFKSLDEKYETKKTETKCSDIKQLIYNIAEYIPSAKHLIDVYVNTTRNHLWEKEIQQQVARENNYSPNSLDTDYFIIDTEYQDLGRFDIVALRWDSTSSARKLSKSFSPVITVFEVKQGFGAISNDCGLECHINDFNDFLLTRDIDAFKDDMISVFNQKCNLGLIRGAEKYKAITKVADEIEFVFLLANYKHASTKLGSELKKIGDCKFIYANPMGYGLYHKNIIHKNDFIKMFNVL